MTTTEKTPLAAVKRGADVLDKQMPDWLHRVDLDRLDLGSCVQCVLGQLSGRHDFAAYESVLRELAPEDENEEDWAERHGFDTSSLDYDYEELTTAWKQYITGRQTGEEAA